MGAALGEFVAEVVDEVEELGIERLVYHEVQCGVMHHQGLADTLDRQEDATHLYRHVYRHACSMLYYKSYYGTSIVQLQSYCRNNEGPIVLV